MIDTSFFAETCVLSVRWHLDEPVETAQLSGGQIIRASLGAALWRGDVELRTNYHAQQAGLEARLARLSRPGQTLLAWDPRHNGPIADPGGVWLGAAAPVIHTLDPDNLRLRVSGLPAGYVLSRGDYLGFTYGSNPTRYALHRLDQSATASGAGLTPLFEVAPHIRPGAQTGAAVALIRPPIRAVLLAAEYGQSELNVTKGARFAVQQVLGV